MDPSLRYNKIIICGAARTGTTLLHYMMRTFKEALVVPGEVPGVYMPSMHPFSSTVVVTKAPMDVFSVDPIMILYPHALLVFTIRDPRDTLCSKVNGEYGHKIYKPYYSHRIADSIRMRDHAMQVYPQNVIAIKYEKLVQVPDEIQERLSNLTGMTIYTPFSKYYEIPDIPRLNDEFTLRPISDSSIGSWRLPENREWLKEVMDTEKGLYVEDILAKCVTLECYETDNKWMEVLNE